MKTITSLEQVTKRIADRLRAETGEIDSIQLGQIVYYAHAWYFAAADGKARLFVEQSVAHRHGATVSGIDAVTTTAALVMIDDDAEQLISDVITAYLLFSRNNLIHFACNERPWLDARTERTPTEEGSDVITDADILNYFQSKMAD